MKLLWNALSAVAILNILAIAAGLGWLAATERIDGRRVHEIREMFVETTVERNRREALKEKELELQQMEAQALEEAARPPVPAAEVASLRLEQSSADLARIQGIRREVEILQETLQRERRALDADRAAFEQEQSEFRQARSVIERTEGSAQFKKVLATYEGLKPDRAYMALSQLIEQGQSEQVVAYLNAMQERTRVRIIDEFLKDDPRVATDLLERLRLRGLAAREPENAPG
jgi:hypothetical protein